MNCPGLDLIFKRFSWDHAGIVPQLSLNMSRCADSERIKQVFHAHNFYLILQKSAQILDLLLTSLSRMKR